ncbi:SUF system Fe-S cluster assembly regulator [Pseudofrancisella aestuarii]|uniref:SUF system Fe-S cluster assembly regulator n=1 Tax=Pseudofrancisella aestuarii TaxID=2670347 RepID=A0ABV9TA96_9GAMM|nr:SUF system Fe-S cluster assembly regulator [Pseudofrancisella aestuarii]
MLKISKLLDYALLVVVTIAKNSDAPYSASKISEVTGLNLPTVRKLLNLLNIGGIIISKRGIEGGYALARNADQISMLDIVKSIETDVNITECCDTFKNSCLMKKCSLHSYWKIVNHKILDMFANTSIDEILTIEKSNKF